MPNPPWPVLYEDNHLLVVNKPAGLPTMGVAEDKPSLLSQAKRYIKQKHHKPGAVYLGIVSRLDAPVTGVLVIARTSKAASRLTDQFRRRRVEKLYWAVVEGQLEAEQGRLVDWLRKDERHRRMHTTGPDAAGAQEARLEFRVLRRLHDRTLVEVELETGRKHQIRVQFAEAGCPVFGDRKYGGQRRIASGIALHARRLVFDHPTRGDSLSFTAPLPACWKSLGLGDLSQWDDENS
jgi:23S rRNA pseudouridine1911/1915/1917 synthase